MLTTNLPQTSATPASFKLPILRLGSSGSTVRILQQMLNFKGFTIEVSGEFNLSTQDAVKDFQFLNDLGVDGIVDAKTWYYLSFELLPFAF